MTQTKTFWMALMTGAVLLYLLGIGLALFPNTRLTGILILAVVVLLHAAEIKTALRIGREHGLKDRHIILMDMLFGFTWWLPLQKGYLHRPTHAIRDRAE